MHPPLISFVTWNRLGLTARNLKRLLATTDDFELHIIDSCSQDDTWRYIEGIRDERICERTRLSCNRGPVYAVNYSMAQRKKGQYFITLDSDVNIHTDDWVSRFLRAFEYFPEMGLLGAVTREYYERYRVPAIKRELQGLSCLQITRGFIEGCCQCLRPELADILGYWCEETCMGDVELSYRVMNFTSYRAAFLQNIEIDQLQLIPCDACKVTDLCTLRDKGTTCFETRNRGYLNPAFRTKFGHKYKEFVRDMESGKRSAYCASVHDEDSMRNHYFNRESAEQNFRFYSGE